MHPVVRNQLLRAEGDPEWKRPWWLIPALLSVVFLTVAAAAGSGGLFLAYQSLASGYVPITEKLNAEYTGLTEVYDRNGVLLGTISNPHAPLANPVPLDRISPWMQEATVSTEDNSFWTNPGVNPGGLFRAVRENYAGGGIGSGSGGSSITQQLVKNVYLTNDCEEVNGTRVCVAPRTLERKLKEIAYSFELEREADKHQILNWYLNSISYADRYVGVEAASEGYFRKPAADLTLAEAAVLAGVPAAPTDYHPRLNCERDEAGVCITDEQGRTVLSGAAKERQRHVLDLLAEHGRITREQADAAYAEPVLVYPATSALKAAAWIDSQVEPRLVRMCEAGILPRLPHTENCEESVHSAGYKVTTTIDWEETQKAIAMMNENLAAGLKAGCDCHNAAIATIEPATGQIIVYAPNIDPTWTSDPRVSGQIDQLTEINQPGSSMKPAVYLGYMDKLQKVPLSSIWDTSPMVYSDPKAVQNRVTILNPRPGNGGEGLITVRSALGGSQNVGAFRAAQEIGIPSVIAYAKALGITTLDSGFDPTWYDHDAIFYGPSVAVGGANVRAIDMAYMNATIANMGYMVGVPTLAKQLDPKDLVSFADAKTDDDKAKARSQYLDFSRGHTRLPGSRELDPVVVLEVKAIQGETLYTHGDDLVRKAVVDPESVWLLHSVMSDCTARWIIWPCGGSNDDNLLDAFLDGTKIPMGIKTGTQQGPTANDTLATWMNGYTRYAGTAVWVGNANKQLVRDGAGAGYASANTTIRLFKRWMAQYHGDLKAKGVFETPANFDDLRPQDVAWVKYQTATTERGARGGCGQMIEGWVRTDISYKGDCDGKGYVPLPPFQADQALALARARGIPTSGFAGIPVLVTGAATVPAAVPTQAARPPQAAIAPTPTESPSQPTPAPTKPTSPPPTPTAIPPTPPPAQPTPTKPPPTAPTGGGGGASNNSNAGGAGPPGQSR
ncbi:MAG: transglycosylase domain-containing protein [Dehalococcoidia bacterium]